MLQTRRAKKRNKKLLAGISKRAKKTRQRDAKAKAAGAAQ
jgi:hypothetical protein